MKKAIGVLILLSYSCLEARQRVVLAPLECIYKPIRILWHCARIGIAIPQFEYCRRCIMNHPYFTMQPHIAIPDWEFTPLAIAAIGGISSLQNGIKGLSKELCSQKNHQ